MTAATLRLRGDRAEVGFGRFDLAAYERFLAVKQLPEKQLAWDWRTGEYTVTFPARFAHLLDPSVPKPQPILLPLASHLFDYQAAIATWALEAKRFACWMDTGTGKTAVFLEFGRQVLTRTAGRVLVLSPLQIIDQTCGQATTFYGDGLPIERLETREELARWCVGSGPGLAITNYEKLIPGQLNELRHLAGLILDECFAAGTPVDTPAGPVPIERLRPGDSVLNAAGTAVVLATRRKRVDRVLAVTLAVSGAASRIFCSENHPWLTPRGWVAAKDLKEGDLLVRTEQAMRVVRGRLHGSSAQRPHQVLRAVLLSEMAYAPAGDSRSGALAGGGSEAWPEQERLASLGIARRGAGVGAHPKPEPDGTPRSATAVLCCAEGDGPQAEPSGRQRPGPHGAATDAVGRTWPRLGAGARRVAGAAQGRLPDALQARSGPAGVAPWGGGRRQLAPVETGHGREEGPDAGFARVDRIEVLERGCEEFAVISGGEDQVTLYDLEVARHPSFSVNGVLVHNSSILKTGGGTIKWNLIKSARGIEYKLSCTATPAPNEAMEYASQAAFLETIRHEGEVIWTWFSRDKRGEWSIKPHARKAFYRWMSSWSIYLRDPARFGWRDILATLPEPEWLEERLPLTAEQRDAMQDVCAQAGAGLLPERLGVRERAKLAQLARGFLYVGTGRDRRIVEIDSMKPARVTEIVRTEVAAGRPTIVWTVFDEEAVILARLLADLGPVVVDGSVPQEDRAGLLATFLTGDSPVLITKAQVGGYGLNLQRAKSMVFSGFDDSAERMYQAVRRAYRYGQTDRVRVFVPYVPELEGLMWTNVRAKEARFLADVAAQEAEYLDVLKGRSA